MEDEKQGDGDVRFITLLDAALHLARDQRETFLREVCPTEPAVLADLIEHLGWEERMGDFLREPLLRRTYADRPFQPGDLAAGRFRIVREAGRGAMGVIYEAVDERLEQRRALKCARPGFQKRLPPEARAAMQVTHDNICRVYEIHTAETEQGPIDILCMEYVDGETLAARLTSPLPPAEALGILRQLCLGLGAAHKHNLLHRDLKTNNVMLGPDQRVVIMDFGLARESTLDSEFLSSNELRGAPAYIAPELWKGKGASVASDLYALGSVAYEMVTGRHPFPADAGMEQRLTQTPAPPSFHNPALDGVWDRVVLRCLDPDPTKRFSSVEEIQDTLAPRTRSHIWLWAAAGLVAAGGIGIYSTRPRVLFDSPAMARLAILRPVVTGCETALIAGSFYDVSDRLQRLRGLVLIPFSESVDGNVTNVADARAKLGATHVLDSGVHCASGTVDVQTKVVDAKSELVVRNLASSYTASTLSEMSTALVGTVTAALKLTPGDPPEQVARQAYPSYAKGIFLNRRDKQGSDQAISLFREASELDPKSVLPLTGLTEAYLSKYRATADQQWLSKARAVLHEAEGRSPDSAAVHFEAGGLSRATGSYDQAAESYRRALQLEPWNGDAWDHLAITYGAMQGRQADAAAAFAKAIELQPGYFEPHVDFGIFYFRLGAYLEAGEQFLSATKLAPADVPSHSDLCAVYTAMGRYGEAEASCRRALDLKPAALTYNNLGAILAYEGRDSEALIQYRKAIQLEPGKHWYFQNTGDSLRRLHRPIEGQTDYRKGKELAQGVLRENPADAAARSFAGYFAIRLGDVEAGENEIEQALHFAPDNAPALRNAVLAYEAIDERDRTLALLDNAPTGLLYELNRHPDLGALRQDSRFRELLRKRKR